MCFSEKKWKEKIFYGDIIRGLFFCVLLNVVLVGGMDQVVKKGTDPIYIYDYFVKA